MQKYISFANEKIKLTCNMKNYQYDYSGLRLNGFAMIALTIIEPILIIIFAVAMETEPSGLYIFLIAVLGLLFIFGLVGYITQEPNEARVMIFFGKYCGTFTRTGFTWVNPLISRKKISLRLRNMDLDPIKVNDKMGNPVLIGMVMVWKVSDTYRAVFDVDASSLGASGAINSSAFERFARIQADAALREVTGRFAYDNIEGQHEEITLRDGGEIINKMLEEKINERLAMAGLEAVEARLNYLAYAPEIAAVMLRRQQAVAIISAREKIVEGAVGMVKMALDQLKEQGVVHLSEEKKADMAGNLLVVLCGDEPAQPVLNTNG